MLYLSCFLLYQFLQPVNQAGEDGKGIFHWLRSGQIYAGTLENIQSVLRTTCLEKTKIGIYSAGHTVQDPPRESVRARNARGILVNVIIRIQVPEGGPGDADLLPVIFHFISITLSKKIGH